ncbi:prefoldin subunit 6 [Thelephora terrestris]|uniref:Prefoldin subunit 6 n=1 Tax=Thelephora terrestris TaxID=56493 RepID=A0A9P6LAF0_9AGAM|nr:prefoldin subunit 6 [Thelephora terrestris]
MEKLQARLQASSAEYQKIQNDLSVAVDSRQRLDSQLQENEMVKKEFSQLTPKNEVYKLIGPVLVKQDQQEAKANVDQRLGLIQGDIKRVEAQIKEIGAKLDKKKVELAEIQGSMQQLDKPPAGPALTA